MSFIKAVELFLLGLTGKVPIVVFVAMGSLIEEIIAPIPSPLVMMTAGTLAQAQHQRFAYLLWIALIAAVFKTLGCWLFYFLGDKAEDLVTTRFGKFLDLNHKDVKEVGKLFNGTSKDEIILTLIRAFPIMPTTPISLACGFIKMNLRSYLGATLVGTYLRSLMFLYVGYSGLTFLKSMVGGVNSAESMMNIVIGAIIVGILAFIYYKRGKGGLHQWLKKKVGNFSDKNPK